MNRHQAVEVRTLSAAVPNQERGGDRALECLPKTGQARVDGAPPHAQGVGQLVGAQPTPDVQVEERVLLGAQPGGRGPDELGELLRLDGLRRVEGGRVGQLSEAEAEALAREEASTAP